MEKCISQAHYSKTNNFLIKGHCMKYEKKPVFNNFTCVFFCKSFEQTHQPSLQVSFSENHDSIIAKESYV